MQTEQLSTMRDPTLAHAGSQPQTRPSRLLSRALSLALQLAIDCSGRELCVASQSDRIKSDQAKCRLLRSQRPAVPTRCRARSLAHDVHQAVATGINQRRWKNFRSCLGWPRAIVWAASCCRQAPADLTSDRLGRRGSGRSSQPASPPAD